ncbi:MAG: ABC transporter ATP-binding protein [Spirochaetaceae bacterium]|nr:ABC transporter ATP-binding protein [Spirochaetaceae bacterium]
MPILDVQNLTKKYRSVTAVDSVSFTVEPGEIFGMIGPNGAGKTTTIECALGLRRPTGGRVRLLEMDPSTERRKLFVRVGVQLQETAYQDHIRVREICSAIACMYERPRDWRELLDRFNLADRAKDKVSKLSGGMRQRLSIALALIPGPEIVFLDELTTGLDPRARREMWGDIRRLRDDGVTIFMTTHYMEEAEYLCDRVAVIRGGELVALDRVESLLSSSDLDHEISFEAPGLDESRLLMIPGVRSVHRDDTRIVLACDSQHVLTDLVRLLDREDISFANVRTRSPGLEDVFLHLTGEEFES